MPSYIGKAFTRGREALNIQSKMLQNCLVTLLVLLNGEGKYQHNGSRLIANWL